MNVSIFFRLLCETAAVLYVLRFPLKFAREKLACGRPELIPCVPFGKVSTLSADQPSHKPELQNPTLQESAFTLVSIHQC